MTLAERFKAMYQTRWTNWLNRRLPPTQDIVLNQRRVFIFLSPHGRLVGLLLAALFIAGINYANNLLLGMCFFLFSLLIVTIHHTFANLSGLRVTAITTSPAFAGDVAGFTIRLSNPNHRIYYSLDLYWDGVTTHVERVEREHDVTLYLRSKVRGRFYPPRLKISTRYPLGILQAWTWLAMDLNAVIYPQPMATDSMPTGNDDNEPSEHSQKRRAGIDDFEGLKQFHAGDPLAHVSWKHLARGQGMLIKTYSEPVTGSNTLDYHALVGLDKESRLSRLAWWVVKLSQQQQPFALKLPHKTLSVATGNQHREECLTALALFEEHA